VTFDLVIRNGMVVDGSGLPAYRADVGVSGSRITHIGRIASRSGAREIDADGDIVAPGFIDGHTHMDAQLFWDPLGSCSCYHGVTTVVMGNCGFTLAPASQENRDLVLSNLELAEDIPRAAMERGIEWTWDSFPAYLDAVDKAPKAINYAAQIGHSALRTEVMGERAFTDVATDDDVQRMVMLIDDAFRAGAFGFTTSRTINHYTAAGQPVASRQASWDEVTHLGSRAGLAGGAVFEIALDSKDPDEMRDIHRRLRAFALDTGVPVTFGIRRWNMQEQLDLLDSINRDGGRAFGQTRSEPFSHIISFRATVPFDRLPGWQSFRALPLDEQIRLLHDPAVKQQLVLAASDPGSADLLSDPSSPHPQHQMPSYEDLQVLLTPDLHNPSVAQLAQERGVSPVELMLDLARDSGYEQTFGRFTGWEEDDLAVAMKHPRGVMTFSDAGAHVSQILGASIQTRLLSYWVRERAVFSIEEAIRMLTLVPAVAWSIPERGIIREGVIADLNVIDPDTIGPGLPTMELDLPSGAPRIKQKATGLRATVVGGQQTLDDGNPTGTQSGSLLRRRSLLAH
jgi:N-acyl-D-amino-acid deacylase